MATTNKLAELLLRRKELIQKVEQVRHIQGKDLFELKRKRQKVSEDYDDVEALVPKLQLSQVTHEFDFYAKRLRLVDAAIQQANWTTDVSVVGDVEVMKDYAEVHPKTDVAKAERDQA